MNKKTYLIIISICVVVGAELLFSPQLSQAATTGCAWGQFEVLKNLPDMQLGNNICQTVSNQATNNGFSTIIQWFINFLVVFIIFAVLGSLLVGGYIYMTAGGSADRVQLAKTWIISALLGMTIALSAWIILGLINPTLI